MTSLHDREGYAELSAITSPPPSSYALALKRTELANNRTLLAFVRTSLGLGGFGLAIAKLFPDAGDAVLGTAVCVALAACTLATGVWQWLSARRFMKTM